MPADIAYSTPTLPFPWSDGPGIAPVLGDPDLWPLVVIGHHRQVIKSIRPPQILGRRRLAVDDDASFGAVVVELLASPATRAAASQRLRAWVRRGGYEAHFGVADLLAEQLVLWIATAFASPCAPLLADAIRPTIAQSSLTPARFRELASTLPATPSIHAALLACAQGILRRRDALAYASVLIDHAPEYKDLLFGPQHKELCASLAVVSGDQITALGTTADPVGVDGPALRIAPIQSGTPIARAPEAASLSSPATNERVESARHTETLPAVIDVVVDLPERGPVVATTPTLMVAAEVPPEPPYADDGSPEIVTRLAEIRRLAADLGVSPNIPDTSLFSSDQEFLDELDLITMELHERVQRRDEVEVFATASAERILAADPLEHTERLDTEASALLLEAIGGGSSRAPRAVRWRDILDDDLLVVALVANVLHTDRDRAVRSLASFPSSLGHRVARGLDTRHLAELLVPGTTRIASLELVARVLSDRRHSTLLPYLRPALYVEDAALSPKARALLEACITAGERGEPVDAILRSLSAGRQVDEDETRVLILALIDQPPGMTGIYHRLRLGAQARYLRPLRGLIVDGEPHAVLAGFDALGDLESMIAECISDLPGNALRALADQHIEQTRRYLANFRDLLEEWEAGPEDPTARPGARGIVAAWAALVDAGDDLIPDLNRRVKEPGPNAGLTGDAERWWYRDGESGLVVDESAIRPAMIRSWISTTRGEEVPLAAWAWERARVLLDRDWSAAMSVKRMLAAGQPRAARLAADVEPALARVVTPAIAAESAGIEARYAAPLSRARELRALSSEVDEYLASIEEALGAPDFAEAELWLEGLDDLLIEVTLRADPERRALLDLLAEAGERPSTPRPSQDELHADVEALREREGERRWHVLVLETPEAGIADHLRARLRGLAITLDRPSRWPSVARARSLGDAIEALLLYTQRQRDHWREYHDIDPDEVTREFVHLLERALPALPDGDDIERILDLRRAIDLHAPFEHIAERISPTLRRRVDEAYFESVRAKAREHLQRGDYARVLADLRGIPGAEPLLLRAELGEHLHRGTPLDLDWLGLRRVIHQLRSCDDAPAPQLDALDAIALVIAETPPRTWPIDHLAASPRAQGGEVQLQAALFVLSLHLRVAQQRPPSEGITLAMVLPEQLFRVWARWQLDLDYMSVPDGHLLIWRQVRSLWDPDGRGNVMRIPDPGDKFPSFRCFALFAQVAASTRRVAGLERTVHDLYAALRTLQVRHDGAHALAQASAERRRSFFALIDRWLDRLYDACPVPVEREDIEALLVPPT